MTVAEVGSRMSARELAEWGVLEAMRAQAKHMQHLAQITEQRRTRHSG